MQEDRNLELSAAIEAVLFKLNEPTSVKKLSQILGENAEKVKEGLVDLKKNLEGRGIDLLENHDEYSLVTSKKAASMIEKMVKDEMGRDIGKAGLETLSIVLYNGPLSRREVDYIRGVNSTFILRSLMVRGLVERTDPTESSGRGPQYRATSSLLSFLGISKIGELPEYSKVKEEIAEAYKNDAQN